MSRLLENVAKDILARYQVAVPRYLVARNASEAREAAEHLGGAVVLKGLVPVGKRGKAGAVKFAASPAEAESVARTLLGMNVRGFPVEKLLVEEKVDIARELYVSVTFDSSSKLPVVIASAEGGVDIEEVAARDPSRIYTCLVDPFRGFPPFRSKEIWSELGLEGGDLRAATDILVRIYEAFEKSDATILEVNPLAITGAGKAVAAAVLMGVDDDALFRHAELHSVVEPGSDRSWRPLTDLEKHIIEVDAADPYRGTARYTEMEGGDIGFFCGGGGGSLLMFDTLKNCGGAPANYTEFGGNPTERKVFGLAKGILSKPGVRGFFLVANITNNTQTDVVAEGIIRAFKEMEIDVARFPVVIRLAGVNEPRARELLGTAGIEYHGDDITMEDAARLMVQKMRAAFPGYGAK
ncbi:MAG: acetate--CoA ligase family protein [Chloroflexi bacterium]|nr:acetate--CoA ligase family protein [Chloroflexota bacterium]